MGIKLIIIANLRPVFRLDIPNGMPCDVWVSMSSF